MEKDKIETIIEKQTKSKVKNIDKFSDRSYPKIFFQYISAFIESFKRDKIINENEKFVIRYTDEEGVNAATFTQEGIHFITINFDSIIKIYDQFYRLLCLPNVFKDVGTNKSCRLIVGDKPIVTDQFIIFTNVPLDKDRQHLGEVLSYFSMLFMIYHEIGHQFDGHVDLIKKRSKLVNGFYIKLSDHDFQTLEMDADAFAASQLVHTIFNLYGKSPFINCKDDMFLCFGYSIAILFSLFENYDEKNNNEAIMLPKYYRLSLVIGSASALFKSLYNFDYNNVANKITEYSFDALMNLQLLNNFQQAIHESNSLEQILSNHNFGNEIQTEILNT